MIRCSCCKNRPLGDFYIFWTLRFFISSIEEDVSHKRKGLRNLSTDHSSSLNSEAFSIRNRDSITIVVCRLMGDNLLCSTKNRSFFDIICNPKLLLHFYHTRINQKKQGLVLVHVTLDSLVEIGFQQDCQVCRYYIPSLLIKTSCGRSKISRKKRSSILRRYVNSSELSKLY